MMYDNLFSCAVGENIYLLTYLLTLSRKPDHSSFVTYIVHVMKRLCDVAHLSLELRICENDRT